MKGTVDTLIKALLVAGVCAAILFWVFWGGNEHDVIGTLALIVGAGALVVAAVCVLILIFAGLASVTEVPGRLIANRRARIGAEARAERYAKLEAGRERHRATRAAWLRRVRERIASEPPAWEGGNRAAFVWLHARQGKTVKIRKRQEERQQRYHYGEHNATDWEAQEPTEWTSTTWVVELPDDALNPVEHDDRVDESGTTVRWAIPGVDTLPISRGRVTCDARGIEIRFPATSWSDVNDYDYGYFGTYAEVVRIED
jgi:hypothetical protein